MQNKNFKLKNGITYHKSMTIGDYYRSPCSGLSSSHPLQHHYLKALVRKL